MTDRRAIPLLLLLLMFPAGGASARVYLTVQQALDAVFPSPAKVERRTLYLDDEQARRAAESAGGPVDARVVPYYVGASAGRVLGYAYFDTHLVRTLPETILVLVGPDATIRRIDILSFDEPEDYLPSKRWLEQFPGRGAADLGARQGIHALTGATLSSRAITQAAKRVLALHLLFVAPSASGQRGGAAEPRP
jgi:FMN-binding protein